MEYTKLVSNIYSSLPPSTSRINKSEITDTGASGCYLQDDTPYNISLQPTFPIKVKQPNGQILQYNKGYRMALEKVPDEAI